MNTYGYAVYKHHSGMPLFIVEIHSSLFAGVSVFSTNREAQKYIAKEKEMHKMYLKLAHTDRKNWDLEYDPDFRFTPEIINAYMDENLRLFSKIENRQIYVKFAG